MAEWTQRWRRLQFYVKWTACRTFPQIKKTCSVVWSKLAGHEIRPSPPASFWKHTCLLACIFKIACYITVGIFFFFLHFPPYLDVPVHRSYIFKSPLRFLAFFFVLLCISQSLGARSCVRALCQHQYSVFFIVSFIFFPPPLTSTNRRCLSVDDKSESVQPVHFVGTAEEPEPAGTYGLHLHAGRHISQAAERLWGKALLCCLPPRWSAAHSCQVLQPSGQWDRRSHRTYTCIYTNHPTVNSPEIRTHAPWHEDGTSAWFSAADWLW